MRPSPRDAHVSVITALSVGRAMQVHTEISGHRVICTTPSPHDTHSVYCCTSQRVRNLAPATDNLFTYLFNP